MAVFWFGWAKKLKNIFTKQQADTYYLQKNSNQLQQVNGLVDFKSNIVCKRNGYVDNVDTNDPTSMINKRYLEEQTLSKTSTTAQTVAGPVNLRSSIELGTEIKAGYGGGSVKFIPEDNSTKTLQFYNANPNDTRRFNLLVPNPTAAQNPATKQYVDNKISEPTLLGTLTLNNRNPNNQLLSIRAFNNRYPLYFEVAFNKISSSSPHDTIHFCATVFPPTPGDFFKLLDERIIDVYSGGSTSGNIVLFSKINTDTQLQFLSNDPQTKYQYIKVYGTPR